MILTIEPPQTTICIDNELCGQGCMFMRDINNTYKCCLFQNHKGNFIELDTDGDGYPVRHSECVACTDHAKYLKINKQFEGV